MTYHRVEREIFGQKLVIEHPMGAVSWKEDCVQQVMEVEGVRSVSFDQC